MPCEIQDAFQNPQFFSKVPGQLLRAPPMTRERGRAQNPLDTSRVSSRSESVSLCTVWVRAIDASQVVDTTQPPLEVDATPGISMVGGHIHNLVPELGLELRSVLHGMHCGPQSLKHNRDVDY